jgi:circadian clock protein KaiC
MHDDSAAIWLPTGVENLDQILGGGIARGAIVMIVGVPGTGKSILSLQIAFQRIAAGEKVLYLTSYSETHEKLVRHTQQLDFFVPGQVGQGIELVSLPSLLREGAEQTEDAIVATVRAFGAQLVVLDGFGNMRGFLGSELEATDFLYSLGAKLALLGATTVLTIEGEIERAPRYAELTVADVVLTLRRELHGSWERRLLQVAKARGAAPLLGVHAFTIDRHGLTIWPRFESLRYPPAAWSEARAGFGIPELDAMLGGGLTVGTITLVAGSPGVGKTLLGLQFVMDAARAAEPALFVGFMESAAQLRAKAAMFGMDLAAAEASGQVRLVTQASADMEADQIADLIRADQAARGTRRLVIDSVTELERGVWSQARKPGFFGALVGYLRGHQITTYITQDISLIVGPTLDFSDTQLSVLAENLLLLRRVELLGHLRTTFAVLKMRFSAYDEAIHAYQIQDGRGFVMQGPMQNVEGLLSGAARSIEGPTRSVASEPQTGEPWPRS